MKLRPFELALVGIFGGLAVLALILLSSFSGNSNNNDDTENNLIVGQVEIWGTLPSEPITRLLRELGEEDESFKGVSYRYVPSEDFDETLTNALADDLGPDLILMTHERLVDQRRRIWPIDYESYPLRDIRSQFVDGAEVFALSDGLYGMPVFVDPMMMYWNRDILSSEGFLNAPRTWEELVSVQFPKLVERDFDRTIYRSVVAMGEYRNIRNAFGILSTLLIQSGSKMVDEQEGSYVVQLQSAVQGDTDPLKTIADFYVRFSKPSDSLYSWNRSFSSDRTQFIGEDLVLYFGYGSEGSEIEVLNPNLNFDIAEIPQSESATVRRTYGRFYGLAALKSSDNIGSAFSVMYTLAGGNIAQRLADEYNVVPVYRELVAAGSNDTYGRLSYQAATVAYGWLNPDIDRTDEIFFTMTSDINENRRSVHTAAQDVTLRLRDEYIK